VLKNTISSWPKYSEEEISAVNKVLKSNKVNYWTGTEGRKFESEFANFSQCKFAVALANGTLALDLALKVLKINTGDEVIVTPRTFIASISSIVNAGATPIFADVELDSQNISAQTIRQVLTEKNQGDYLCSSCRLAL
jgi:dTDP-4-amino-4,6-dideoxygalactose transaminase